MDDLLNVISTKPDSGRLAALSESVNNGQFALYGAGLTGKLVVEKLAALQLKPKYFIDDTPSKIGTVILEIPVVSSVEFLNKHSDMSVIVSIINPQMNFNLFAKKLNKEGFQNIYSFLELFYSFPDQFLPFMHFDTNENIKQNQTELTKVYNLLSDEASKEIFNSSLSFRLGLDFDSLIQGDFLEYYPTNIIDIPANSIFIDCGAYDGDTIDNFLDKVKEFSAIYAFEPDLNNYQQLIYNVSVKEPEINKKVTVFNFGVGEDKSFLRFNSLNNMASAVDENGNTVIQITGLDSLLWPLLEYNESHIFLKMDVEGEEESALKGARRIIASNKAHLAISLYHRTTDLWKIPMYIHSINLNYNYYLRQHGNDSMDLVLYCMQKT